LSNLLYHIAYINKKLFVAECCFICSTNLSWHHSLQGVCWSGLSGVSATIPGSTSLSQWLEGRGWRDVVQSDSKSNSKSSNVLHELARSKRNLSLFHMRNTISEAAAFKEGGSMQHRTHVQFSGFLQPTS